MFTIKAPAQLLEGLTAVLGFALIWTSCTDHGRW